MKRFLALLLAFSLCFGMLPMPGLAEAAEETQEAVLEEDIPDETVEAAEPEPSEEAAEEPAGETPEEIFAAEEALPESGPVLVITEQPEDTLTVEGVAYFVVSAQAEQDGQVLEEAEVSFQWQKLDGDIWVTLEGETGEILAVEAPEVGDTYRCLVTWEDLEAVSEAAAVVGEEEPLDYTSEVRINPAYRDLFSEEDFSDAFEISTNASAISCTSREAALAAIREAMVKREPVITLELNYSYGSLNDEVEALTAHMYDHNGDPKQGDYLGYAVGGYSYGWGGRQFFLQDIKYYTTAAQELQADAAVKQILASLNLDGKTDLQKINAIYNWLVRNVKYVSDAELADQTNLAKYAGYAALVQRKAVCQGYAGAFYRLCLEAGVDSRVISCQNMHHAWNIIQVGDWYYHVDATWDANTPDSWRYYLKGTVNWLKDHQSSTTNYISELGDQFQDSGFASDYPVPEEDYNSLALSADGTLTLRVDDPAWRQSYSTQVLNGKTVTTAPWGKKANEIRKVVIEEGVTGISANAFYGCSNLESVEFPASLRSIGRNAFDGCGLTSVTIGANVELVESYAFQNNPGLTSVTFEGASTQVQNFSFEQSPVENLTLPAGLKLTFGALGSQSSVQSLKHLTLTGSGPMADYTSSQSATWGYSGLETVTFAPGITTVGAYAFVNCVQLKSNIELPAALTKIGEGAFYASYYIPGFTFTGSQVPEIGDTAFASIQSLTCAYPCAWAAAPNSNFGARAINWQQAAHSLTHHEAQAPTVGKDGWLEYWQCDVCGRYYLTESAETPVAWENIRQEALPAEKGCQIAFDGNTTEELLGSMTPIQALWDADVTLPKCNFTVFGYTFTGWNTQADGKGVMYQPGDTVRNLAEEGTVTLYAQWKANTYRLVFRPGAEEGTYSGSTDAMVDLVNGESYKMTENGYNRPGYAFVGWYREGWPDDLWQPGEDFRFTKVEQEAEIAFIASWTPITYTIRVEGNGIEHSAIIRNVPYDMDYSLQIEEDFRRPGYRLTGWNTKADGTGTGYALGQTVRNLCDVQDGVAVLYAQWEENFESGTCGKNLTWRLEDGTLTISGSGEMYDYEDKNLEEAAPWARYTVEKLVLENGITYIGNNAFCDTEISGNLVLPDSLLKIGEAAFNGLSGLTGTLRIPGKVQEIGDYAFSGCGFEGTLILPNGIKRIGDSSFASCEGITSIEFSEEMSEIPDYAFNSCTGLSGKLVLPNGIQRIGESAFEGCEELTAVEFPATIKEIGKDAFHLCYELADVFYSGTRAQWEVIQGNEELYEVVFHFADTSYTITYQNVPQGIENSNPTTGTSDAAVTLENLTRTGYWFDGWFDETEQKVMQIPAGQEQDLVLYARWTPITYTVRFNANKGTGKMADQKNIAFDTPANLTENAFTRKGYSFTGWNTKANGTGEDVAEAYNLTTKNNAVVTLYAMWEANTYTVVFHGPDGDTKTQAMTYDQNEALASNPFEKDGYTFAKWNTQENGKGKAYTNNAKVKNLSTGDEEVDLFAQWTPNKYTVEFHSNFGTKDTVKKQTLTYDGKETALTANGFTWKGHAFLGWALSADGEVEYQDKQSVQNLTTGKTVALYAQWKVNEYTVAFDSNGAGQADVEQSMTYDVAADLKENTFIRPGYDFSGWATTAKGKAVHTDGKQVKNLTDKNGAVVRLYAVWTPHTYTVEFGKGEGTVTGTMKSQKMTYGKAAALTGVGFKRTSYTFDGWKFGDGILLNKEKVSDLTTVQNGTVTLTALWTPTKYTVSYQGLTAAEREDLLQTYTVETTEGLGEPTRPGCEFQGWFLDAKCTKEFDGFEGRTGTLKLYPKWTGTACKYTVKFASGASDATGNMDKATISAVSGKEYAPKACAFKRTGYVFNGWMLPDGTVITTKGRFSNLAQENGEVVELTATWKPITYKVRFNANKGTGKMADQTGLVYDEPAALKENTFTRSGYTFHGWNTKANGTGKSYGDGAMVENLTATNNGTVTLYAQWIKNP